MINKKIITLIISIITVLSFYSVSNAAIESRPNKTGLSDNSYNHFIKIRKMETEGGTLGLNAKLDETNYVEKNGASNGVDVHLSRNVEYGTILLFGLSDYGTFTGSGSDVNSNISNLTGNCTGVMDSNGGDTGFVTTGIYEGNNGTSAVDVADRKV